MFKAKYASENENQQPYSNNVEKTLSTSYSKSMTIPGSVRKENRMTKSALSVVDSNILPPESYPTERQQPAPQPASLQLAPSEPALRLGPSPSQDKSLQARKPRSKSAKKALKNPVRFVDNPIEVNSSSTPPTQTNLSDRNRDANWDNISPAPITVEKSMKHRVELAGRTPKLRLLALILNHFKT